MSVFCAGILMTGCSGADADKAVEGENDTEAAAEAESDAAAGPYDSYIKSAIASVDDTSSETVEKEPEKENTAQPFDGKSIQIDRSAPEKLYYSTMENTDVTNEPSPGEQETSPTPTPVPTTSPGDSEKDASPTPTKDPSGTPEPTPTPYITPEEFEVGTCCIYMNGESDSAYGSEVVTAINKARTDLGYEPLVTNKGLDTCADRRTRELAAYNSHTRPNGLPFYSLAPEHFKAEILMVGEQKAEDAVDTLIKKDPFSRSMIFTTKYKSIGASSFKCNGMECMVVAFGL